MGRLHTPALGALLLGIAAVGALAMFRSGPRPTVAPAPVAMQARRPALPRALLGAGSCSSSGCHAGDPAETQHPGRSAYSVWATRDRHAQAEQVLHEGLAEKIVAALARQDPAFGQEPASAQRACIGCHATARDALASDGVSCESCHGGAGDWLVAHTLPGWRTAGNALGMVDLADPFTCAQACAECHVGGLPTADGFPREVTHDFLAAGHPRLAFELRSFKAAEPPHWRDRFAAVPDGTAADEVHTVPDPFVEWALGRRGTLHAYLTLLSAQAQRSATSAQPAELPAGSAQPAELPAGHQPPGWPEFAAFDCYSCHRLPLPHKDPLASPGALPPGTPRLEPLQWALLDLATPAEQAAVLSGVRQALERQWWQPPTAENLQPALSALKHSTALPSAAQQSAGAVARRVVAGIDPASWDEAAAAFQALDALSARATSQGASATELAALTTGLKRLRAALEFKTQERSGQRLQFNSPHQFDAAHVAQELDRLATLFESLPDRP